MLNNPEFRKACSTKGLERVRFEFTQKHIAEQTIKVYQQILKGQTK